MKNKVLCLLLIALATPVQTYTQSYPFWGDLKSGPFAVGFKNVETYDYSRQFRLRVNSQEPYLKAARPMQVSIWYPAEPESDATQMPFQEYVNLFASSVQRDRAVNPTDRMKAFIHLIINRTKELARKPTEEEVDELFKEKTAAYKNAPEKPGIFPVILISANSAYSRQVMCEYLASYGFVVATCAEPLDPIMRNMVQVDQPESNARDFEFLMSYIQSFPNARRTKPGLALWSSTSLGGLIFQLRNMYASAVLSMEGHETYVNGSEILQNSPYFDPLRMQVPYMRMAIPNKLKGRWATDKSILDSFKYAEQYNLTFHSLEHNDVGGAFALMLGLVPESKKGGYETICRFAVNFFKAYLKDDRESLRYLQKSPVAHGPQNDFLTFEYTAALPAILTKMEFFSLIRDGEKNDTALEILTEARKRNPELVLFEEWMFNRHGYGFLRAGKADKAVKIFELVVAAYPESANAYDSLGEAYAKNNQTELAIKAYKKSLQLDPANSNAEEMLKQLRANN